MEMLTLPGPDGALEARHDAPQADRQAILCHPHPQYGGNMDDPVLDALARALLGAGLGVLRFNFRGVGASEGRYDGVSGEIDDLLSAAAWLRRQGPGALWCGGYSFGAWVLWGALGQGLEPDRAILLAPPLGAMSFPDQALPCPVDAVAGTADPFVDQDLLGAWRGVRCHPISGADHFFSGRHRELRDTLGAIVGAP